MSLNVELEIFIFTKFFSNPKESFSQSLKPESHLTGLVLMKEIKW